MWTFDQHEDAPAAVHETGTALSYGALRAAGDRIAEAIGPRALVLCLCSNTLGALVGYTALMRHRHAAVLLEATARPQAIDDVTSAYQPQLVWGPEHITRPGWSAVTSLQGHTLWRTGHSAVPLFPELALLLSTSGSTGSRKMVRVSYDNVRANTAAIVDALGIHSGDRAITTLPMSYAYGLSVINTHLAVGARLALTDAPLSQRAFWRFLEEQQPTSLAGVPYTYQMLRQMRFLGMQLPALVTLTQAGGRLPVELQRELAAHAQSTGRRFFVMYGQTEATARITCLPAALAGEKLGSVGRAIPGSSLWLEDDAGNTVTQVGAVGQLITRGPNVTLGYAEHAGDLSRGDERHGRLATGDLARCDADGCFTIVGRAARFLKIHGRRVSLDETEALLAARFAGVELACTGVDDKLVVAVSDAALVPALTDAAAELTGTHRSAITVLHMHALPRTGAGKVDYAALQAGGGQTHS